MIIKFKYEGNDITHTLRNRIIKVYSVPKEYSEDGLYISDYSNYMSEPYPASISLDTKLLYHAEYNKVMGEEFMDEKINIIGEVEYA